MSQRRLDALRARMERGATEGERRAAARAYNIHARKMGVDPNKPPPQSDEFAQFVRDWIDGKTSMQMHLCTRCGREYPAGSKHECNPWSILRVRCRHCEVLYEIGSHHECSRVGSPRSKAGPFKPQPPPPPEPSAEEKRGRLMHENTLALMELAQRLTRDGLRVQQVVHIDLGGGFKSVNITTRKA